MVQNNNKTAILLVLVILGGLGVRFYGLGESLRTIEAKELADLKAEGVKGNLTEILKEYDGKATLALLMSDGNLKWSETQSVNLPVFTVPLGSPGEYKDLLIKTVKAPSLAFREREVVIDATIKSYGYTGLTIPVLLKEGNQDILLEVKSCTLVGERVAMFPDAVTERGARHLRELAKISEKGIRTILLFVVHWPFAKVFMPDFHTDLSFSQTLLCVRNRVKVIAVAVRWNQDLSLSSDKNLSKGETKPCKPEKFISASLTGSGSQGGQGRQPLRPHGRGRDIQERAQGHGSLSMCKTATATRCLTQPFSFCVPRSMSLCKPTLEETLSAMTWHPGPVKLNRRSAAIWEPPFGT
jgi:hypothetical protein